VTPELFIYGLGFSGQALARRMQAKGWAVSATARSQDKAAALIGLNITPVNPADTDAMAAAMGRAKAILITAPPGPDGCPALQQIVPALALSGAFPDWIGYVSTTGVYGDQGGGWVFENSPLRASSLEGARRVGAERDWQQVAQGMGLSVMVFRLPGIYGPGRSAFDRLRAGDARRVIKPGQVFSRIHVEDIASGLAASIARPRAGGIYNLCDDEPAPPQDVIAYAAGLAGLALPPEVGVETLSPMAQRFYAENKRVSNALAKQELGWKPAYRTYRQGLDAIWNQTAKPLD
jgi:nucleoside-diphosphate-sugar epimerase